VWLGFGRPQIARALETAGFTAVRVDELTTEAAAKGPALFRAVAVKSGS
jgi:hypothetical protein